MLYGVIHSFITVISKLSSYNLFNSSGRLPFLTLFYSLFIKIDAKQKKILEQHRLFRLLSITNNYTLWCHIQSIAWSHSSSCSRQPILKNLVANFHFHQIFIWKNYFRTNIDKRDIREKISLVKLLCLIRLILPRRVFLILK